MSIVEFLFSFYEKNGLFCLTKFLTNNNDQERKEKCLKAFHNASLFEEEYKLKITEEGIFDNLIDLLQHDENPVEIQELCFSIIANLCNECVKNKRIFRKKGGVDLIVNSLKDPRLINSSRYSLFTISVLDCLWNSILGNRKNENIFLDNEGLYVLLEFLESSDVMHKKLTLSSLSFLIENPKAVNYFCDWNSSKSMINATQLLIRIYEKEDARFGVTYDDGIISNFERPLNPQKVESNFFGLDKKKSFKDFDNKLVVSYGRTTTYDSKK